MVFSEKQKINGLGFKILYGIISVPVLVSVFLTEQQNGIMGIGNWLLIIGLAFFLLGIYLIVFETTAYTKVDRAGISYKYRPFIWNFKCISWNEIKSAQLHTIHPIRDFGGWGFRFSIKKGKAIIMSSGYGVVIIKTNGKKFSISTKRKLELERVIEFWMNEIKQNG